MTNPSLDSSQRSSHARVWWIITAACAVAIFILSIIPVPDVPVVSDVPHVDKIVHVCEYLVFAWMLVQAVRASRMPEREYLLWVWIFATSYGMLMEVIQLMVPWRSADWLDALSNALGAAVGVWLGQRWGVRVIR